jgi:hypothetical protein
MGILNGTVVREGICFFQRELIFMREHYAFSPPQRLSVLSNALISGLGGEPWIGQAAKQNIPKRAANSHLEPAHQVRCIRKLNQAACSGGERV